MNKQLPIGISNFKEIIDNKYYYVDKTLFIDDIIKFGGKVTLLPRPRRFGKTLNMSMLKYFFEITKASHAYLFEDKKIWQLPECRVLQGKFPVIFLTFKDIKESSWDVTLGKLISTLAAEYTRHKYLLELETLDENEKTVFKNICAKSATIDEYHNSLKNLTEFLDRYHNAKPLVLFDEYDSPIHAGFMHGYYSQVIEFMRGLMTGVFKDNSYLEKGVITGILRTAKEGIFSGLNNLDVFTVLDEIMDDKFGFTEQEVGTLLKEADLASIHEDFQKWYNGYLMGKTKIYNPWSVLNCVKRGGSFITYWANTSDNALIYKIIAQAESHFKEACADLIAGKVLENIEIEDKMALPGMLKDSNSVWSLLLFSGYVTIDTFELSKKSKNICSLVLPNEELHILFADMASDLFKQSLNYSEIHALDDALRRADGKLFSKLVSRFVIQSMSSHDIPADEIERSYHLFFLGLLVVFAEKYNVKSNRESGYGRLDIMLIPRDKTLPGFVIEFKKKDDDETMEECTERALDQIKTKKYATEIYTTGIKEVIGFGIACYKKDVLLKQENLANIN